MPRIRTRSSRRLLAAAVAVGLASALVGLACWLEHAKSARLVRLIQDTYPSQLARLRAAGASMAHHDSRDLAQFEVDRELFGAPGIHEVRINVSSERAVGLFSSGNADFERCRGSFGLSPSPSHPTARCFSCRRSDGSSFQAVEYYEVVQGPQGKDRTLVLRVDAAAVEVPDPASRAHSRNP